ncbi:MAG: XdhC family protein, partial [Gammaproteobacteria bacterium]
SAASSTASRASSSASSSALSAIQAALEDAASTRQVGWIRSSEPAMRIFALPLSLPPRVLLLGAGPDTLPVVDLSSRMGWKVTLIDHRPSYAQPGHFPDAERVVLARPEEIASAVDLSAFTAAVVMSHHLASDLAYLRALAATTVPYVGLLGPAIRREKLLSDLGDAAIQLRPRLRAPVGLALGGRTPESIALAIVAEIHAFVHDARGSPFSELG